MRSLTVVCKKVYFIYCLLTIVQVMQCRNADAHESSVDFARLLLSQDTNTYEFWKDAFPILYHGTVEEVAARDSYVDKMLPLHLADT